MTAERALRKVAAVRATGDLLRRWPLPEPSSAGDKVDRGNLLVIAGCDEIPGAAILAATAALRAGVGKLTVATAPSVTHLIAQALPEARVFSVRRLLSGFKGALNESFDTVLIGPGMPPSTSTLKLVRAVLPHCARATIVLDAGAIGSMADPVAQRALDGSAAASRCIITPHAGEMAKLTGLEKNYIDENSSLVAHRVALSGRTVVALKGATTWIATVEKLWFHEGHDVGLATAGSGDVLAGVIAGLAARGAGAAQATVWGVVLHAMSGARLRKRHGLLGLLARELPHEIPAIMETLRRR